MKRSPFIRGFFQAQVVVPLCLGGALSVVTPAAPPDRTPGGPERIVVPSIPVQPESEGFDWDSEEGAERRFDSERFRARFENHWFRRKAYLEQNLPDAAEEQLHEMRELAREMGVEKMTAYAAALVHEGDEYLREGNFTRARASYKSALDFNPGLAHAHSGLASAAWRSGQGIGKALGHWAAASLASVRESWFSFRAIANGLVALLLAFGALVCGVALALMLRYQRAFRHDVEEAFVGRLPAGLAKLAGVVALFLPLVTWFLAVLTPVYWLAIFFRYGRPVEKSLSLGLLALIILVGPLGELASATSRLAGNPTAQLLLESSGRSREPGAIMALTELATSYPEDPLYPALLGNLYAKGEFLKEALWHYRRAAELSPGDARLQNNIGNLYYKVGRFGEASQKYQRAIELDGSLLVPSVNLYLARQAMFDFRGANDALQRGRNIDADEIARLLDRQQGPDGSQEPLDAEVPRSEIWKRILTAHSWRGSFFRTVGAGLRSSVSIAGAVSVFLALVLGAIRSGQRALLCVQCGRAYCRLCQAPSEAPDHCVQCRHLFIVRDGLHPSVRAEKMDEIARNGRIGRILARLVSLPLPGTGWILGGKTLGGAMLLFVWCLIVGIILMNGRGLIPALAPAPGTTLVIPAMAMAGVVWIMGNLTAVRES